MSSPATTITELQRQAERQLRQAGIASARLDSLILLEEVLGKPRAWLLAHGDTDTNSADAERLRELVGHRANRIPLTHLTHRREFYGLELYIDERVLTPRNETELMVEYAARHVPHGGRLVDVGTGSGALALATKKSRPDLDVWASELSAAALAVARINGRRTGLTIHLQQSDLLENLPADLTFDAITANLPYLRDDARDELMPEVQKEPAVALFAGEDGLDLYRRLFRQLAGRLNPDGYVFTECDPWQQAPLRQLAQAVGLTPIEESDRFILAFRLQ